MLIKLAYPERNAAEVIMISRLVEYLQTDANIQDMSRRFEGKKLTHLRTKQYFVTDLSLQFQ